MKELIIEATTENLDTVLEFIGEALEAADCPIEQQMPISVAVEEIYVNIAHYAYDSETGYTSIRISVGDEVTIEFEDKGTPYNPLEKDDPDTDAALFDRPIGGLGIFMVKKMMDTVVYRREGNKNIMTIKKSI